MRSRIHRRRLLAAVVLTAACGRATPEAAVDAAPLSALPGLDLAAADDVDALDLAATADGTLHVAWREVVAEPGDGPRYRTRYARGAEGGARWDLPEEVPAAGEVPRLVAGDETLHLLAGGGLRHWTRDPRQGPWQPRPPLLGAGGATAATFAAALADDVLVAAFFAREGSGGWGLYAVRQAGQGSPEPPRRLLAFPPSAFDPPAPCLVAAGGRLHLLAGFNGEERTIIEVEGRRSESVASRARLVYFGSGDGAESWTAPEEIPPGRGGPPPVIEDLALTVGDDGPVALYDSFGLWASRRRDDWSIPVQVADPGRPGLAGGTGSRSLTAAGGTVAWVDERHRKSDRRWWSPLGGAPWSDNPDWRNNDLFLLSAGELARALGGDPVTPARQTADGSFTRQARLAVAAGRRHLVWTGRRQVGKELSSLGAAPEIFHRALPQPFG